MAELFLFLFYVLCRSWLAMSFAYVCLTNNIQPYPVLLKVIPVSDRFDCLITDSNDQDSHAGTIWDLCWPSNYRCYAWWCYETLQWTLQDLGEHSPNPGAFPVSFSLLSPLKLSIGMNFSTCQLWLQILPDPSTTYYVKVTVDGIFAGNAFACCWGYDNKTTYWLLN